MASVSPPPPHNVAFSAATRLTSVKRPFYPHHSPRYSDSVLCHCAPGGNSSPSSSSGDNPSLFHRRWDSAIQDVLKNAIKSFESIMSSYWKKGKDDRNGIVSGKLGSERKKEEDEEDDEWDWDRWKKHFEQVDEQERLLSVLKSQLSDAVNREDYEDAARLKVAIAAASINDVVGRVMSHLNRAVIEERYQDAVFLRDKAGAGLVGWWSGIPEDVEDPHGLIIRISPEHGRYVARRYSPRQLTISAKGSALFEIFLTTDEKGEFKKQAVYLRSKEFFPDSSTMPSNTSNSSTLLTPPGRMEDKSDLFTESSEDEEEGNDTDDDSDILEDSSGFQNILQNMIPGLKVKVLKVTLPGKVDKDIISQVIEQIMDEEDTEKDIEEDLEVEDEVKGEIDNEKDRIEMDSVQDGIVDNEEGNKIGEIAVKVVIGDVANELSGTLPVKESCRLPAKIKIEGRSSFSLLLEKDVNQEGPSSKESAAVKQKAKLQSKRSIDNLLFDLAKSIEKEKKISLKMLKDVGELLNLTLSQAQKRQQLSGLTNFRRIDITSSPDPLDGLYIGAHSLYTSEVIHLRRQFGQWKDDDDDGSKKSSDIKFYEYVEAVKLTGDPYVPAGKVSFRAKIGKQYQLPHKGIFPEEFGVIARYKGQGRLAEPGFVNPRWVDGELVILDGKYIKAGPVVGFVYWAPEHHFVVFFNRLRLQP